jgi:peroxiredoxin
LAGFQQHLGELTALGASVVAACIDPIDKVKELAQASGITFPMGYGVTRAQADQLGSWWEERRQIIQPSEFVVNAEGKVVVSSYSDGPLGRMDAADVVKLINFYESQKK